MKEQTQKLNKKGITSLERTKRKQRGKDRKLKNIEELVGETK